MTSLPKTIRHSELAGRLVILRDTMQELGHVDVVWMHPPVHRVFGFICASGFLGRKKSAFNLPQLYAVGEDGLLVSSAPVPTDAQKVRQIETLLGHEVWSDSGEKVGNVVDYIFDTKTGAIQAYLFTSHPLGALTDGIYKLYPRQMLSYGDRRIRVRAQVLESPELYKPGLKQKIANVRESVIESAEEEWRSLAEQAATLREQTLERLQALTDQAKHKAVPLSEQAKEQAQSLSQRAKEQGLGFVDRLRDQTRSFTEQLRTEFGDTWEAGAAGDAWSPRENATPGEYHWDTRSPQSALENEFDDEFDDEFEDEWENAPAAARTPSPAVEEDFEDDESDEWDTWDMEESDDGLDDFEDSDDDGDDFSAADESSVVLPVKPELGTGSNLSDTGVAENPVSQTSVPAPVAPEENAPSSTSSTDTRGLDAPEGSEEAQEKKDLAIASSQPTPSIPTEPIPLNDLEDDDPWI